MMNLKKEYFIGFLLLSIVIFSTVDILFENFYNYKLYFFYLIFLSLIPYQIKDVRLKVKEFLSIIYFGFSLILIIVSQYIFSFFESSIVIYGILSVFIGFVFLIFFYVNNYKENSDTYKMPFKIEIILLTFILLVGIYMRIFNLEKIPAGIWFDEAQNGNEVINILENDEITVFIPRFTQMPAMFFYIAAFLCKIFGVDIITLRAVSIITGVLCIIAFYFLIKHLFKDSRYALGGAFLLATSRWHITFSRLAFLGMLSVLLIIIFFYFYFKTIDEKRKDCALYSGFTLGLSLYSFTLPYFAVIYAFSHNIFILVKGPVIYFKKYFKFFLILFLMLIITSFPLLFYAFKNFNDFTARVKDVSIMNDIKSEKSIMPVFRNIYRYLLTFNFAGDYNGRHNLYKKPLLDEVTGVLFILGFLISLIRKSYRKYFFLFLLMLLPGILTVNIEAPQAYRILGASPFVYLLVLIALKEIMNVLLNIKGNKIFLDIFLITVLITSGVINYNQYFILYPKEKASYMDFSPEANGIGKFINENQKDYYILVSKAQNMYGFYFWEQRQILQFMTYKRSKFDYLEDYNRITVDKLIEKKGIAVIVRPSDEKYIERIEREYPDARKKDFINYFNGEILYIVYFIDIDKIKKSNSGEFIIYK
ncbi:MAG: glycosyltransferase family 39 protein [Candidatus Goldbacteria bacterium]|nr:glycosyltransferase family 39 protein [Candidatus Goldiibacteriota bacterium]